MEVKFLNMKRLLVLGIFLVAAVSTMALISAETTQTITLDGIQFNIPEGYNAVEQDLDASEAGDSEDVDGTAVDSETTSEYKNAVGDELKLKVGTRNNQKIDSLNPVGENKTISGKTGYLSKEMDDGKNQFNFEYLQDGKIVKITAVSEDIIGQVIV